MNCQRDHGAPRAETAGGRASLRAQPPASSPAVAVLLDLCNVLFDETIWSRRLFQLVSRMGHQGTYEQFWDTWQREYQPCVARGDFDARAALQAFLQGCGLKRGQIDEAMAAMQSRYRQLGESARPLPGVQSGLAQLHSLGWKIGVLGHVGWSTAEVRRCVERLGVAASIDAVLSVRDLTHSEPHESPYLLATRCLHTHPEHTVFVSANRYHLLDAARQGLSTASVQVTAIVGQRWCIEQLTDLVRVLAVPAAGQARAG